MCVEETNMNARMKETARARAERRAQTQERALWTLEKKKIYRWEKEKRVVRAEEQGRPEQPVGDRG